MQYFWDIFGALVIVFILVTIIYALIKRYSPMHIRIMDIDDEHCHLFITNGIVKHHEHLDRLPATFSFEEINYYWHPKDIDNNIFILSIPGKAGMSKEILKVDFSKQHKTISYGKVTV